MDNKLSYILKLLLFMYIIVQNSASSIQSHLFIAVILIDAAIFIIKQRFLQSKYTIILELVVVFASVYVKSSFIFLYAAVLFDFIYDKFYLGIVLVICGAISAYNHLDINLITICFISAMLAYVMRKMDIKEKSYRKTFDSERRLRYELEKAKARLLNSSRDAAHIAEVRERNRIARDIHDNIGHSIAGIYMQLQVVQKLYGKDDLKSKELLDRSVEGLSSSLKIIRETVHNIKPKEELGIEYITSIIENFKFCDIEFSHNGNISLLSPAHMELLGLNIKEALTNSSKYSKATKINISIDINEKYTRFYFKDNGVGCTNIKEGLGLSGMRDRVKNIGGSLSVSGEAGFIIVSIIPHDIKGGKIFEGTNS